MRVLLVDGYNIIHAWPRLSAILERKAGGRAKGPFPPEPPWPTWRPSRWWWSSTRPRPAAPPCSWKKGPRPRRSMSPGKGPDRRRPHRGTDRAAWRGSSRSVWPPATMPKRDLAWFHGAAVSSAEALAREVEGRPVRDRGGIGDPARARRTPAAPGGARARGGTPAPGRTALPVIDCTGCTDKQFGRPAKEASIT